MKNESREAVEEAVSWAETPFAPGHNVSMVGRKYAEILAAEVRRLREENAQLCGYENYAEQEKDFPISALLSKAAKSQEGA